MASLNGTGVIVDSITRNGRFEPFELQVSRGIITYHTPANVFGYGTTPATAGLFRTVWENMGTTDYSFPGSALTMQLVSTVGTDTASITVNGLDANYNIVSETLVLNGTTNVPTVNQYFRINNINVSTGSASNPSGVITLSNGGTIYAQINTITVNGVLGSIGTSQMALYTVPAGYTLYMSRFSAYSSFNGNSVNYTTYRAVTNTSAGVQRCILQSPFNTEYNVLRVYPFPYLEKTDIRWQIASSVGTAATVGVNIGGVLVKNDGAL
jgi:hypothetical protein